MSTVLIQDNSIKCKTSQQNEFVFYQKIQCIDIKNRLNIELQLILFNLLHPHLLDTNLTT